MSVAKNMPEFFQDENVVWRITFYSDEFRSTAVDPTTVEFKVKSPSGTTSGGTVVNDAGTGNYHSNYVVNEAGIWEWHWQTETPRIVRQGEILVKPRNVA